MLAFHGDDVARLGCIQRRGLNLLRHKGTGLIQGTHASGQDTEKTNERLIFSTQDMDGTDEFAGVVDEKRGHVFR